MKIKVSVPATSANIGSGFDALGLAVTLYNTVTFEESEVLDISSADGTRIPRGESNLVYRSAKGLFEKVGKQIPPLKITQTNPIPMARGLGSSSACIIAGLLGANRMLGDVLNTQELLTLATSIEGHPDNVAPALLGGLTSSVFEDGKVYSVKRNVDETLCFAAIVPDYKLLTEAARAALPKEVSHKDAVYNLSRAALVPAAFCEGRHDLLAIATEDKLHQPYRMPLMPGSKEVFDMARLCGAKAVYVSGAGSTVMAVAEKADAEKFYTKLEKGLELPKAVGDILGMSLFALFLGAGRALYGVYGHKCRVHNVMLVGAAAAFICYITVALCDIKIISLLACGICGIAVSLLWPGTLVVASEKYPLAGAWMFAILAAGGDIGGSLGPWLMGKVADCGPQIASFINSASFTAEQIGLKASMLVGAIFPLACFFCLIAAKKLHVK